jgi:hypothetical protein
MSIRALPLANHFLHWPTRLAVRTTTAAYWPVVIRTADLDGPTPRIFQDHYPNLNPTGDESLPDGATSGKELAMQPICGIRRELTMAAESPTAMPFPSLGNPWSLAVDNKGTVYVTDSGSNQVLTLAGGGGASTALPFAGLASPSAWPWTVRATSTSMAPLLSRC